jgi:hypothetical protein
LDLHNDSDYIAFVKIRGFCVRIGPKFIVPSGFVGTEDEMNNVIQIAVNREFIAKPVEGEDFRIGYGEPNYYIERVLRVHIQLIMWFSMQYKARLRELRSKRYTSANDKYDYAPPDYFLEEVKSAVTHYLEVNGIKDIESKYEVVLSRDVSSQSTTTSSTSRQS